MRSECVVALLACVAACELETVNVPRTQQQVALHSVLSPTAASQVVLLERTRNGSVTNYLPPFDVEDQAGSDGGIAESGATVALIQPNGDTVYAIEDAITIGKGIGNGVYRFALDGSQLQRRAAYRLIVRTKDGTRLGGETSVPDGAPATTPHAAPFDRVRDTVVLEWPRSASARSYFVRIETPFGPRMFFTDSTRLRLTGELRNVQASGVPRVFIPGFPQAVTVSAVDSNYYDWFRSHNDEIAGRGVISRITGGIGVFGSLVRLRFESWDVVAPQTDAEAGHWVLVGPADQLANAPYSSLDLYVESRASRSEQTDAISGRAQHNLQIGEPGCGTCGVLGSSRNGQLVLALLSGWYARDTTEVFSGKLYGDTLVGRYRGLGFDAVFVKQH